MLDALELAHVDEASFAKTPPPQPALMEPEFGLLNSVHFPLNPHSLPNFRLKGNDVHINITTLDSANSSEYQLAIIHLGRRGCTVMIDRERSENFVNIEIIAPRSLFSTEAIARLESNQKVEKTRIEQAAQAKGIAEPFFPEWGC